MNKNRMKLPLFDDYWIDFRFNTIRRWFAPEPYSMAPAGAYSSMVYDPERNVYRIYYEVMSDKNDGDVRQLKMVESTDLKNFTQVQNRDGSDVIYFGESGVHGASVLYDSHDQDSSRRYKFCGMTGIASARTLGRWAVKVEIACSPDGIHFENRHDMIAHPYFSDTQNRLMYNPLESEYCLFHRSGRGDRRVLMSTSKDLKHWNEPRLILQPGPNYNNEYNGMQHYSFSAHYMDGIFYGLLWRYNTCLYDMDFTRMFGYMEPELVYSYDGREYLYTSGRPLMERPLPPEPGCAGLAPCDMCESTDGQSYYILCAGSAAPHCPEEYKGDLPEEALGKTTKTGNPIYKIRKDAFCGIESVGPGGKVITKPMELLEDDLTFNLRANNGYVRFGLMHADGSFLEGFSFDDCVPFVYGDSIEVRPCWKEHTLKEALHRQVRVAIELNTAILHCISATARPRLVHPQKSFADPTGPEG